MPFEIVPHSHAPARYRLTPGRRNAAAERRRLERELAAAVQQGRLLLHYQPRLALATGEIRGAEALLRWPNRERRMVAPSLFLPIAEQSGQIVPIGGWMLRVACRQARHWQTPGMVSVSVSTRQIALGALLAQVAAALEDSGLPPELLELELPEPQLAAVDTETLLALSAVRDLGVGLALDDFGAGGASLATLRRLPLTTLKLGRALVGGLPGDQEDAAIARAVIAAAHALGLTVVAEAIETEAQRAFLAASGCDEGQGCLFSEPVAPEHLPRRLAA